ALNGTALATLERFKTGLSLEAIAAERDLSLSTIESHLAKAVESGEKIDPHRLYTEAEETEMRRAFEGHDGLALSPIFEKLGGKISYGKLKLFLAFEQTLAVRL
ncbi:MAG: helix-turn-helix domain-containing protein, partial [Verrucomicrobiales bacterium]